MADAKSKEQLEREWWDAWWAEDYSWDGLGHRAISGTGGLHGEQTLQDYWRRDPTTGAVRTDAALEAAGELVADLNGVVWHIVHFPARGQGEFASWKNDPAHQNWKQVEDLIAARLREGQGTPLIAGGDAVGVDKRSQLCGCVIREFNGHPDGKGNPVHVDAVRMSVMLGAGCREQQFGASRFSNAWFSGATDFTDAHFGGEVHFNEARFGGDVAFDSAVFADDVVFDFIVVLGDFIFDSAKVAGSWFNSITFHKGASFGYARFGKQCGFDYAEFGGEADFKRVRFVENVSFLQSVFQDVARFNYAEFHGEAEFTGVNFEKTAGFNLAIFKSNAWFDAFPGICTFNGPAIFDSALFEAPARFFGAKFKARMSFDKTKFLAIADFAGIGLPASEPDWRGAFTGALFEATCDLRASGVKMDDTSTADPDPAYSNEEIRSFACARAVSLVSGATFDRGVLLDGISEASEREAHDMALADIARAKRGYFRESALEALEGGALRLKRAMEADSNFARAQRFYRLELRARSKRRGTKFSEKGLSWIYKWTADYGGAIGRPLVTLLGMILAFAVVFWAWEGGAVHGSKVWAGRSLANPGQSIDREFVDALRFSLSRTFPFGPWAVNDDRLTSVEECGFASRFLALDVPPSATTADPDTVPAMIECRPQGFDLDAAQLAGHRLWVGVISTLESLLSLPLYFLFGLAVRRKFQIS